MASPDFKALQDEVQKALVTTVKSANRIAAEDLAFQRTVNPSVADELDETTARLLGLSHKLLKSAAEVCGQGSVPELEDADDVDMHWRKIVDVLDNVLEKADRSIDEFTGVLKRKDAPTETVGKPISVDVVMNRSLTCNKTPNAKKPRTALASNMRNANIAKPQLEFERAIDNTSWRPVLSKKPNASVPLEESLAKDSAESGSKHPYEAEILAAKYPERVYQKAEPILYHPVKSTTAKWVDTYEGVLEMLGELKKAKEIAVDLEHHDTRTYAGLLSLMQISTRDQDWIVDTLKPWRHQLEVLNEVFTDPKIVKYFTLRRRLLVLTNAMSTYTPTTPNTWKTSGTMSGLLRDSEGRPPHTCQTETVGILGYGPIGTYLVP
ncbi:Exosome complex exonuclease rrp6 like protein [Verticillium longisporum]|nr:Exosome complex exonuclease rrp6 like protein [Verticillium longisporum]